MPAAGKALPVGLFGEQSHSRRVRSSAAASRASVGSEKSALVGGQHEVEPEARERLQGGDGSGHEREFFEAVDLFVGGFGDDRAVAVDEEGFFHNRKFLTVSIIRAFSAGVPTVMRRHPSQPGMRERLRTMTPAEISASYMRSGSGVRTRMKLASEG